MAGRKISNKYLCLKNRCNTQGGVKEGFEILLAEAVGVATGFIGASFIGNVAESSIGTVATKDSSILTKIQGWFVNNTSKIISYIIIGKMFDGAIIVGIQKAMAGSVLIDTAIRITNNGASPPINLFGCNADILSLEQKSLYDNIQNNNIVLRNQLNDALNKLANRSINSPINPSINPSINSRLQMNPSNPIQKA